MRRVFPVSPTLRPYSRPRTTDNIREKEKIGRGCLDRARSDLTGFFDWTWSGLTGRFHWARSEDNNPGYRERVFREGLFREGLYRAIVYRKGVF